MYLLSVKLRNFFLIFAKYCHVLCKCFFVKRYHSQQVLDDFVAWRFSTGLDDELVKQISSTSIFVSSNCRILMVACNLTTIRYFFKRANDTFDNLCQRMWLSHCTNIHMIHSPTFQKLRVFHLDNDKVQDFLPLSRPQRRTYCRAYY